MFAIIVYITIYNKIHNNLNFFIANLDCIRSLVSFQKFMAIAQTVRNPKRLLMVSVRK